MRYQQPIYIQTKLDGVRNRTFPNVNMSSDLCIFNAPTFSVSGASKIVCSGMTGTTYVVSSATTIPLTFSFTGNLETFTANSPTFKYEIYKLNTTVDRFYLPAVYKSADFAYPSFSGTNSFVDSVSTNALGLDGEYLIKGYFVFDNCTDFLGRLGKTVDTINYRSGSQYGLYDSELDFYFIAFKGADKPIFANSGSYSAPVSGLFQQTVLLADKQKQVVINNFYTGYPIITLNGLTLAASQDYTVSGSVVTLVDYGVSGDVLTAIYTTTSNATLAGESTTITTPVVSGTTDNQGTNTVYYNTTTGKYEVYSQSTPSSFSTMIIMINGVTLANNIDFYQSTSNNKRFILSGDLMVGDVVTLVYYPQTSVINGIISSNPVVVWSIADIPQTTDGVFTLEVSYTNDFTSPYYTHSQNYIVGSTFYSDGFPVSGSVGTKLYYRVKNQKAYVNVCGQNLTDTAYSDVMPITIQTNSINSY